jgi:hypothetical protein
MANPRHSHMHVNHARRGIYIDTMLNELLVQPPSPIYLCFHVHHGPPHPRAPRTPFPSAIPAHRGRHPRLLSWCPAPGPQPPQPPLGSRSSSLLNHTCRYVHKSVSPQLPRAPLPFWPHAPLPTRLQPRCDARHPRSSAAHTPWRHHPQPFLIPPFPNLHNFECIQRMNRYMYIYLHFYNFTSIIHLVAHIYGEVIASRTRACRVGSLGTRVEPSLTYTTFRFT